MSFIRRREIPIAILSVTILFMIGGYYFSPAAFQLPAKYVTEWVVVITAFMLGLGFVNVLMRDVERISKRTPGQWYFSIITQVCIFGMFLACVANRLMPSTFSGIYRFLYSDVYRSFTMAVQALAGFFIFSAVYRSMRLRKLESGAFTLAHVLAVLSNAPIGALIWAGIPIIGTWINNVVMGAGMRGFIICSALGAVFLGFRYILGKSATIIGGE